MKRHVLGIFLTTLVAIQAGCSCGDSCCPLNLAPGTTTDLPGGLCAGKDGVAYTARERKETRKRVAEMDNRQLNDDLDYLFLQERPSRLSKWPVE